MTSVLGFLALAQAKASAPTKASVAETLAATQAVAASELATWRKGHPTADLTLEFAEDAVPKQAEWTIRKGLGFKNPVPVLDARVLTIVVAAVTRPKPKQAMVDAYVFQGSFPKGFRARYVVSLVGKTPKVVSRALVENYEIQPVKRPT